MTTRTHSATEFLAHAADSAASDFVADRDCSILACAARAVDCTARPRRAGSAVAFARPRRRTLDGH